jgi:hypothetical protein
MRRRRFYLVMGFVALAVVVAGFGPGLFGAHRNAPLSRLAWLHGVIFSAWLVFYLLQAALVALQRRDLHRRLGLAGAALAALMAGVGYATTIAMGRRGFDLSGELNIEADPLGNMIFPLGDLASFALLVIAAFVYRRKPEIHKRLMLLATIGSLMAAPLAHVLGRLPAFHEMPAIILVPLACLYLSGAVYDRVTLGRFHAVTLWGGLALLVWGQLRAAVIGPSATWHHFAAWLIS